MALKINEVAPDFTLQSTEGKKITLSNDLAGRPLVLYFYPKDFTTVCTQEACSFRDQFDVFKNLGIVVLGVNKASFEMHLKFKEEYKLPFELLSDPSGRTCRAYKALMPIFGMVKRVTYLLDKQHKVVAVYENLLKGEAHTKEMLANIEKLEF